MNINDLWSELINMNDLWAYLVSQKGSALIYYNLLIPPVDGFLSETSEKPLRLQPTASFRTTGACHAAPSHQTLLDQSVIHTEITHIK